jgi:hypothetical protein
MAFLPGKGGARRTEFSPTPTMMMMIWFSRRSPKRRDSWNGAGDLPHQAATRTNGQIGRHAGADARGTTLREVAYFFMIQLKSLSGFLSHRGRRRLQELALMVDDRPHAHVRGNLSGAGILMRCFGSSMASSLSHL